MREAVLAVVEHKFGATGTYKVNPIGSYFQGSDVLKNVEGISQKAIDATISYCEYIWKNYQRFPAYLAPFRTVLGFQAGHLDLEFYEKFYKPEAITETQRANDR
jgi:hypothetical protein